MAIEKINIEKFLELSQSIAVLDVRSPGEYRQAHIPGAFSFPLFTDEERKVVGTAYKQQSRQTAIKIGLDYFGPKMREMVEEAEKIVWGLGFGVLGSSIEQPTLNTKPQTQNPVIVHCWRGGMRSAAIAWLLDMYGFKVYTLVGGYKAFRSWVRKQFEVSYRLHILGGYTGAGKTETLKELGRMDERIVDLEDFAGHKGSAFGNIGLPVQPSQEMFENKLALALKAASDESAPVWLEDESQRIGTVNIPQPLWLAMRRSPIFFLDIPFEERLEHLVTEYGSLDKERVLEATARLQKRLGGLETKTAIAYLQEGNVRECFRILLKYYDKYYHKGLNNRENVDSLLTNIHCKHVLAEQNASSVLAAGKPVSA